jgi:hypothetical protein
MRHDTQWMRRDTQWMRRDTQWMRHDTQWMRHDTRWMRHDTQWMRHDTQLMRHDTRWMRHDTHWIYLLRTKIRLFDFVFSQDNFLVHHAQTCSGAWKGSYLKAKFPFLEVVESALISTHYCQVIKFRVLGANFPPITRLSITRLFGKAIPYKALPYLTAQLIQVGI